jgi:hypothetical protein
MFYQSLCDGKDKHFSLSACLLANLNKGLYTIINSWRNHVRNDLVAPTVYNSVNDAQGTISTLMTLCEFSLK